MICNMICNINWHIAELPSIDIINLSFKINNNYNTI